MLDKEKVKELMESKGVTFKELAKMLNVCEQTARNKFKNNRWYVHDLVILCEILGVEIREITY